MATTVGVLRSAVFTTVSTTLVLALTGVPAGTDCAVTVQFSARMTTEACGSAEPKLTLCDEMPSVPSWSWAALALTPTRFGMLWAEEVVGGGALDSDETGTTVIGPQAVVAISRPAPTRT